MLDVAWSLVPVVSLIALGVFLRRMRLLDVAGWAALERLTYFVLFPPLMFMSIVGGSFAGGDALRLAATMVVAELVIAAIMILGRRLIPAPGPQFSSIFQAGLRWNGYFALAIISGLHGEPGVALAAVGFAALSPINNVLSVLVLTRYAGSAPAPVSRVLRLFFTNPLILSTIAACILVVAGVRVSQPVGYTLNLLGDATISLGLICVGAALDFSSMRSAKIPLAIGTVLRVAIMPAITFCFALLFGLSGMSLSVVMICVAAPVATTAYIMARQLGGDATLMANVTTLTTFISLVTLPLTLMLVRLLG